jgi:predicted transcriptional regulator
MGTITISVDDDVEKQFRKVASDTLGERKGYLGEATTEAMRLYIREKTQAEIAKDALILLESGVHYGTRHAQTRADLYE